MEFSISKSPWLLYNETLLSSKKLYHMTFNIHKWGMYLSIQFTKLLTYTLFKKLHWQLQCQPSTCSLAQKNELNGFLSSSGGGSGGGSRDQSWASPFPFYYHENKFSYYCKLVWQTLRGEWVCMCTTLRSQFSPSTVGPKDWTQLIRLALISPDHHETSDKGNRLSPMTTES